VNAPILDVKRLVKEYVTRDAKLNKRVARAVDDVSFEVFAGETFAIVGESGSGKSTIGRVVLNLTEATDGHVVLLGEETAGLSERRFRPHRRAIQLVFQDPLAAFDPRVTIRSSLREFLSLNGSLTRAEQSEMIDEAIRHVGLGSEIASRKPGQVSGGQLQRLSIARSLLVEPKILFLDEPTSSLDVSIRGQIVNLLLDRQEEEGLSYLLVTHDLRVVYAMAHRVAVMYLGQFVEVGNRDQVYAGGRHPYTRGLLDAAALDEPELLGERVRLSGELTADAADAPGCRLTARCPYAEARCDEPQTLRPVEDGHLVRCWKAVEEPVSIGLPTPSRSAATAAPSAGDMATPNEFTSPED
jgi:oligopeptide/dipeptide ABC transporter ATP-binding protein